VGVGFFSAGKGVELGGYWRHGDYRSFQFAWPPKILEIAPRAGDVAAGKHGICWKGAFIGLC